jgi:hypothetical protein
MKPRAVITIILAFLMVLVVMAIAVLMTLGNTVKAEKVITDNTWTESITNPLYLKLIDLTGDGQKDLFVQTDSAFYVYDVETRQVLFEHVYDMPFQFTFRDMDGDQVEDVITYSMEDYATLMFFSGGEMIASYPIEEVMIPARVAVLPSDGEQILIMGDDFGNLAGVSTTGDVLWTDNLGGGTIVGMGDAETGRDIVIVVAVEDGEVAAFSAAGEQVWRYRASEPLRHLRSYDPDGDGVGEIFLGGDVGKLFVISAADGSELLVKPAGQEVTRIGEAELDGDPTSREIYYGGKDGGVWAMQLDGTQLWTGYVTEKVTAVENFDVNDDGIDEVFIGDRNGTVRMFLSPDGNGQNVASMSGQVMRFDTGKIGDFRQLLAVGGGTMNALTISVLSSSSVFRFAPLLIGGIIALVIIGAAWFISTLPAKPATKVTFSDQSVEALKSRRRMLRESVADVERLKRSGEIQTDAYLARLKELRGQLAETETGLRKSGESIQVETFTCPHCGGTLPLGRDKCDYCGQVVIS